MKIIKLEAENIKCLRAIAIEPTEAIVEITGPNGVGKTAVLDCVDWVLSGAKYIQSSPVREGEDKARIRVELGEDDEIELVVERKFREKDDGFATTIGVFSADGARFPSPQALLDTLRDNLTIDPLAFSRMTPAEQRRVLLRFVDLDLDEIDALNKSDYDARTDLNREAKALGSRADAIDAPDARPEPMDEDALVRELSRAGEHNAAIERAADAVSANRDRLAGREGEMVDIRGRVERYKLARKNIQDVIASAPEIPEPVDEAEIERRIASAQGELRAAVAHNHTVVSARAERSNAMDRIEHADDEIAAAAALRKVAAVNIATARRAVEDAPKPATPINTAEVEAKIGAARVSNENTRRWDERERLCQAHAKAKSASSVLTKAMETRDAEKLAAIAASDLPVEGLGITTECVTLDGLPFEQASGADQLLASTAISVARSPRLRVICIRDGSLLDDAHLAKLGKYARERKLQVFIERVNSSGTVGFVIEDGTVKP